MFSHFNLIGLATWRLSCPVTIADELLLFKPRNCGLAVTCCVAATGSAGSVIGIHKSHYWLVHVQGVQLGDFFICLLCYRGCWPVASVTVLTVARARRDTVRLRVGRHAQSSSSLDVCSVWGAPSCGSCLPLLAPWPNGLNQWPILTQCTIAWLPVIILLHFAHVIFIDINVDKIINAFTKNFL